MTTPRSVPPRFHSTTPTGSRMVAQARDHVPPPRAPGLSANGSLCSESTTFFTLEVYVHYDARPFKPTQSSRSCWRVANVSRRSVPAVAIALVYALSYAGVLAHADAPSALAKWIATATRPDTAWVHRLGMRLVPRVDSLAAGRRWWSPRMVSSELARSGWSERFTRLLSDSLTYFPGGRCAPADTAARPADDLVVGVDFGTCDSCAFAVCYFHEGCVRLATRRGPAGALSIDGPRGRHELLALFSEALPHDDVVRRAAGAAPESLGAGRDWNDPNPGDYVFAEEEPVAIVKAPPVYPDAARRKGVEGTVTVLALVAANGLVKRTLIQHSIPLLDEAATQSVSQWIFKPALSGGKPIAVWVTVPVRFHLP